VIRMMVRGMALAFLVCLLVPARRWQTDENPGVRRRPGGRRVFI